MLHELLQVWFGWVRDGGYLGIVALMAMESSILPVPSEVVIPPAAFWALQGRMSMVGVVLAGTFGSWLGVGDQLLGVALDRPRGDSSLGQAGDDSCGQPGSGGALRGAV